MNGICKDCNKPLPVHEVLVLRTVMEIASGQDPVESAFLCDDCALKRLERKPS